MGEILLTNIGTITVQVTGQDGNTYGVHPLGTRLMGKPLGGK